MDHAIEAVGLVKTYRPSYPGGGKTVQALDHLTFSVNAGTIFGLLGPNGAGKSTTMKILTTLSTPDSGRALVAGHDVLSAADSVRRVIGYVSQKSGVDTESTGRENLILQGQLHGLRGPDLMKRVDDMLERFQLKDAASRPARTFSGGMQRKLDIAMGLIHKPKVLFLDEPTTGLDPEARTALWTLIAGLAEGGLTILLTTHYLDEADRLARRIAIVDKGKVVVEGTPSELKGDLRGDSVQILFQDPPADLEARAKQALANVPGIGEIMAAGATLRARADQGATAVPPMLAALTAQGFQVASVQLSHPSLDDVYLRHTGRSFAEAEAGGSK